MSKAIKISIICVMLIVLILGVAGLVYIFKPQPKAQHVLTQRLDTPTNVALDTEHWILSFDTVRYAEMYEITINDTNVVCKETSIDVSQYVQDCGLYSFQVSALYSMPDYNSYKSKPVYGEKYDTLSTPVNLNWGDSNVLYWDQVTNAQSYNIVLKYNNGDTVEEETHISFDVSFDFNSILTQPKFSDLTFFTIQVQALANAPGGVLNKYLKNSGFSEEQFYYKNNAIEVPEITLNTYGTTQQTGNKTLSWNVDFAVNEYIVYVDGKEAKKVSREDFANQLEYSLNLNDLVNDKGVHIADTLSEHEVWVEARPLENPNYHIAPQVSVKENYIVTHQLSTVDSRYITIDKKGANLDISWKAIKDANPYNNAEVGYQYYEPSSYSLVLWASMSEDPNSFVKVNEVHDLLTNHYDIMLDSMQSYGKIFKVQVKAVRTGNSYIFGSDFSEFSNNYNAVTALLAPEDLKINIAYGVYRLNWRDLNGINPKFMIDIYRANRVNNQIVLLEKQVSRVVNKPSCFVSDFMFIDGESLPPAYYAVTVTTLGNSIYYANSEPSAPVAFDFKVRLDTPGNVLIKRESGLGNKRNIELSWDYVTNADKYFINVNENMGAIVINQPAEIPGDGRVVNKDEITAYINNFDSPNIYKITVQAVVDDMNGMSEYISSLLSSEVILTITYSHPTPKFMTFTQAENSNVVSLEWQKVESNAVVPYIVTINNKQVTDLQDGVCKIEDISSYLKLGDNVVTIKCGKTGLLYTESGVLEKHFEYNYYLNGSSKLQFTYIEENDNIEILIPSFSTYVSNYYITFSNGKSLSVVAEEDSTGNTKGGVARAYADKTMLPSFVTTTVTVYAGKIDASHNQANLIPCDWSTEFYNNLYIPKPTLKYNDKEKTITITVLKEAMQDINDIYWHMKSVNGVKAGNIVIGDFAESNSYDFDIKTQTLDLVFKHDKFVVGDYEFTITANSNSLNIKSKEAKVKFTITQQLTQPKNFVKAENNTYLQWDAVEDAGSYEVMVDGESITPSISGPFRIVTPEGNKQVVRLNVVDILKTKKIYEFSIKAVGINKFYLTSESATHSWDFDNKLAKPIVEIIDGNLRINKLDVECKYLVKYTVTKGENDFVEISDYAVVEGAFAYYAIKDNLKSSNALGGNYAIEVYAEPTQTDTYTLSDKAALTYTYKTPFAEPNLNVTQSFEQNKLTLSWNALSGQVLTTLGDGVVTEVPEKYKVIIQNDLGEILYEAFITQTTCDVSCTDLQNADGVNYANYIIDVYGVAKTSGFMANGAPASKNFNYQFRLQNPTISLDKKDMLNNDTILISTNNLDKNSVLLEVQLELLGADGNPTATYTINEAKWVIDTVGALDGFKAGKFTLKGGEHLSERGIYRVSVRNLKNMQFATSAFSNAVYVYYGQNFEVADNIKVNLGIDNKITVSFDKLPLPELAKVTSYSATISYQNNSANNSYSVDNISGNSFVFDAAADWVNAFANKATKIKVVITANTTEVDCKPVIDNGFAKFNFAPTSTKTFEYSIGAIREPTGITMVADGTKITIVWKGDDRYPESTYIYSISTKNASGTVKNDYVVREETKTRISFDLLDSNPHIINFSIKSTDNSSGEAIYSPLVEKVFINTQQISDITEFDIVYDGEYKTIWTDVLSSTVDSDLFVDKKYVLSLNGTNFDINAVEVAGGKATFVMTEEMINAALSTGRECTYTIKVADILYTEGNALAYKGVELKGNLIAPVVIKDAPGMFRVEDKVATWSVVKFATQYKVYISKTQGGEIFDGRSVVLTENRLDLNELLNGLSGGDYYVVIQVEEDLENKVYLANDIVKKSIKYTAYDPMGKVENLKIETIVLLDEFATTITWEYHANSKFYIYLENAENVKVFEKTPLTVSSVNSLEFMPSPTVPNWGTYTYTAFNGTKTDLTRKLDAGNYNFNIIALGDGLHADSKPVYKTYKNKFMLKSIDNNDLFKVVPDYFVKNGDAINLEKYENNYKNGLNTKYIIINNQTLTYAKYFDVYIYSELDAKDKYLGRIDNKRFVENGEINFENILNGTKLLLTDFVGGNNTIKFVPCGDSGFYFYYEDGKTYAAESDYAKGKLTSAFEVVLTVREDMPDINEFSLDVTYSNTTNTNVVDLGILFRNAKVGATYRVTPYYQDVYNAGALVTCDSFDVKLTAQDFSNGFFNGIKVFDKVRVYGPNTYYFTVQTLSRNSQFYLDSAIAKTGTVTLKMRLAEFVRYNKNINYDYRLNSAVSEVTKAEENELISNGNIYWTLPVVPYSVVIKYIVTMKDKEDIARNITQSKLHSINYEAYLSINVGPDGKVTYGIEQEENGCFRLDSQNNRIIFDMVTYFENKDRVLDNAGISTGTYYLAGKYDYSIQAITFGKNKASVPGVIFSPKNIYTDEFIYKDIPYPNQPLNPAVDVNGVLRWEISDNMYGEHKLKFCIVVDNHKTDPISFDTLEGVYLFELVEYLSAGGKDRNDVTIYTKSPDRYYYLDGEPVAANLDALNANTELPKINLDWEDQRNLLVKLAYPVTDILYNDIYGNGDKLWYEMKLLKLANWEKGDPVPAEGQSYEDVLQNNAHHELIWTEISFQKYQSFEINVIDYIKNKVNKGEITDPSIWLAGGDSLSGGYYYLKFSLKTDSAFYKGTSKTCERLSSEIWRSDQDNTAIDGPYVTIKQHGVQGFFKDGNEAVWGMTEHKEANFSFYVYTIAKDVDGQIKYFLPKTITIKGRLMLNESFDKDNVKEYTYNIPSPDAFGTNDVYCDLEHNPDVTISRCFITGNQIDFSKIKITIDIHKLFDTNETAGIYNICWILNGDKIGDSSPSRTPYTTKFEVCHYTVLPTPILDYRLGYANDGLYRIGWVLTPNRYDFKINNNCKYDVNLFACEMVNGVYACDTYFESLSSEEKPHYFDIDRQNQNFINNRFINLKALKKITSTQTERSKNTGKTVNRQCFIQDNQFRLEANKSYKIFIYLSPKAVGPFSNFYINSMTSKPVEYTYKKPSNLPSGFKISLKGNPPLEDNINKSESYYKITGTQPDKYNNAFELFVKEPGTDKNLAHWIIGTKDNVSSASGTQNLYVLNDYQDTKFGSGNFSNTPIGTLDGNNRVLVNELKLSEMLQNSAQNLDYTLNPGAYKFTINSWLDNNIVNKNAPKDAMQNLKSEWIFDKTWIEKNVPFANESNKQQIFDTLYDQIFEIPFLNLNSYNKVINLSFNHKIKFLTPKITKLEIFNNPGAKDYVDYSSEGATDGYMKADSDSNYFYRLWLDNVYTEDNLEKEEKRIKVIVNDGGAEGVLEINYTNEKKAYVDISKYDNMTANLFNRLENSIPGKVTFNVVNVPYSANSKCFFESDMSNQISCMLRKQYATPQLNFMFDNMTSNLAGVNAVKYMNGNISNVLSSGNHMGLAVDPYLYITRNNYTSISDLEANHLSGNKLVGNHEALYEIELEYAGNKKNISMYAKHIWNTPNLFKKNSSKDRYNGPIYSETCLYKAMFDLINGNDRNNYHGGKINLTMRTISSSPSNDCWIKSNDSRKVAFEFYTRLDPVVSASLNQSSCSFNETNSYLATKYKQDGYFYYRHSYIPFEYTTISHEADYHIFMTRSGCASYMPSSCGECKISNYSTGSRETVNLANILGNDIGGNQWILSSNPWDINIVAYPKNGANYMTRSYDCKNKNIEYQVKLKLFNDISSFSIDMEPLISRSEKTVDSLDTYALRNTYGVLNNENMGYDGFKSNKAANKMKYRIYNPNNSNYISGTQQIESGDKSYRYYTAICEIINSKIIDTSIFGASGFKMYITLSSDNSNVYDSEENGSFSLDIYKAFSVGSSTISGESISQSGDSLEFSASIANTHLVENMSLYLKQNNELSYISVSSSGNDFSASMSFSKSNADCFDNYADVKDDGDTRHKGYIQAGNNYFVLKPVLSSSINTTYNLVKVNSISLIGYFEVSVSPKIEIKSSEKTYESSAGAPKWEWYSGWTVKEKFGKSVSYGYLDGISITDSNLSGLNLNASFSYGFKSGNSEGMSSAGVAAYSNKETATSISGIKKSFTQKTNYYNLDITVKCKTGYSKYFAESSWKFSENFTAKDLEYKKESYGRTANLKDSLSCSIVSGEGSETYFILFGDDYKDIDLEVNIKFNPDIEELKNFTFNIDFGIRVEYGHVTVNLGGAVGWDHFFNYSYSKDNVSISSGSNYVSFKAKYYASNWDKETTNPCKVSHNYSSVSYSNCKSVKYN